MLISTYQMVITNNYLLYWWLVICDGSVHQGADQRLAIRPVQAQMPRLRILDAEAQSRAGCVAPDDSPVSEL